MPRLVGRGSAARLVLSGENVGAEEALRLGLVDYLVASQEFEPQLEAIVHRYLDAPRAAVIGSKRRMRQAFDGGWDQALAMSLPLLRTCLASADVAAARDARRKRSRAQAPDTLRDS